MTIEYKDSKRISALSADKIIPNSNRGTVTTDGSYTVIKFTEDGTFTPTSAFNVEYLVVGGGGSGGGSVTDVGGGGGAGAFRTATGHAVTAQSYNITVGAGGVGVSGRQNGNAGGDSTFDTITMNGGGYGGEQGNSGGNSATGSGGGGGWTSTSASSSGSYGNNGGFSTNPSLNSAAGGGGSGSAGQNGQGSSVGGAGGNGTSSSITGSAVTYAVGGGGGGYGGTSGVGGAGGSSTTTSNGSADANSSNADPNTGNGSGGTGGSSATRSSGNGGSGVVILRFLTSGNTYETGTPTGGFPTNVQDNSILVEKDTGRRYWSSGYFPSATVTRSDDFSSDGWTDNDSTYIGVSGGSMNWNCKRDGSNDASVYDLTSTSANWVLRFKLTVTNVSSSTQAGNGFYVGLSDSIQTAGQSTSQDFIGVSIYNDNTDTYRTIDADGSALPRIYQGDSNQSTTYNTGSVWYYEIIKTGSSYTVEAFSGSDYSTGSEGKITGSSDASGLRYLKVLNDMESISTSTNPFQGTINDLKFYNGVTSV